MTSGGTYWIPTPSEWKADGQDEVYSLCVVRSIDVYETIVVGSDEVIEALCVPVETRASQVSVNLITTEIYPVNPTLGASDMTSMDYLHIPGILRNLKIRWQRSPRDFYTCISNVLVAVNPLTTQPSPEVGFYMGVNPSTRPPHPYGIAEGVLTQLKRSIMRRNPHNQSVVISGESGSGKTVNAKIVIKYLTEVTGVADGGEANVAQYLKQSNPILEAFGNAKTTRNPNSSRFGKYTKLQYVVVPGSSGLPELRFTGAHMEHYLLEKSRITSPGPHERSYHIFYQLLRGAGESWRSEFGLGGGDPLAFRYLSSNNNAIDVGYAEGRTVDDAEDYMTVTGAFTDLGIGIDEQKIIFRAVAAVLHLGNMSFVDVEGDGGNMEGQPTAEGNAALESAAVCLGVDAPALLQICSRTFNERYSTSRSAALSTQARDAIAKVLYSQLFDWVFERISQCLNASSDERHFIGVLDIFGFESFQRNDFEQLLINYANEELQKTFKVAVIRAEILLYQEEGLMTAEEAAGIMSSDMDSPCVELISNSGRPKGIFQLMEEASQLMGDFETKEQRFIDSVHQTHRKNACFAKVKRVEQGDTFKIKHYAEDVTYHKGNFVHKNIDRVPDELRQLISGTVGEGPGDLLPMLFPHLSGDRGRKRRGRGVNKGICLKFDDQMKSLAGVLGSCDCAFIRCIKPNYDLNVNHGYRDGFVKNQLISLGVLETCKVLQQGYPTRIEFTELDERLRPAMPPEVRSEFDKEKPQTFVKALLWASEVAPDAYKVGNTRVFFAPGRVSVLDSLLTMDPGSDQVRALVQRMDTFLRLTRVLERLHFTLLMQRAFVRTHARVELMKLVEKRIRTFRSEWRQQVRDEYVAELDHESREAERKARDEEDRRRRAEAAAKLRHDREAQRRLEEQQRLEREMAEAKARGGAEAARQVALNAEADRHERRRVKIQESLAKAGIKARKWTFAPMSEIEREAEQRGVSLEGCEDKDHMIARLLGLEEEDPVDVPNTMHVGRIGDTTVFGATRSPRAGSAAGSSVAEPHSPTADVRLSMHGGDLGDGRVSMVDHVAERMSLGPGAGVGSAMEEPPPPPGDLAMSDAPHNNRRKRREQPAAAAALVKTMKVRVEDVDASYINAQLVATPFPRNEKTAAALQVWIQQQSVSSDLPLKYLIWNLSDDKKNAGVYNALGNRVLDTEWKSPGDYSQTPSLELTFRVCAAIQAWCNLGMDHLAIVCCENGKTRTSLLLACYLRYCGEKVSVADGFNAFYLRRSRELSGTLKRANATVLDRVPPSIHRFFRNFDIALDMGSFPASEPLLLKYILVRGMPVEDLPCIDLWDSPRGQFFASYLEPEANKAWEGEDGRGLYRVGQVLSGDFYIICRFGGAWSGFTRDPSKILFRYANSTAVLAKGPMECDKQDCDIMREYVDGFDEDDFSMVLILSSATPESAAASGAAQLPKTLPVGARAGAAGLLEILDSYPELYDASEDARSGWLEQQGFEKIDILEAFGKLDGQAEQLNTEAANAGLVDEEEEAKNGEAEGHNEDESPEEAARREQLAQRSIVASQGRGPEETGPILIVSNGILEGYAEKRMRVGGWKWMFVVLRPTVVDLHKSHEEFDNDLPKYQFPLKHSTKINCAGANIALTNARRRLVLRMRGGPAEAKLWARYITRFVDYLGGKGNIDDLLRRPPPAANGQAVQGPVSRPEQQQRHRPSTVPPQQADASENTIVYSSYVDVKKSMRQYHHRFAVLRANSITTHRDDSHVVDDDGNLTFLESISLNENTTVHELASKKGSWIGKDMRKIVVTTTLPRTGAKQVLHFRPSDQEEVKMWAMHLAQTIYALRRHAPQESALPKKSDDPELTVEEVRDEAGGTEAGSPRAASQDEEASRRARERQDEAREEALRLCMEMFDEADDDGDGLIYGRKVSAYLHRVFPSNEVVLYFMQRFEFTSDSRLDFQAFVNIMRAAQVAFERLQKARQQQKRQAQQESTTQMVQRYNQDGNEDSLLNGWINN